MILTGEEISNQVSMQRIKISPFNREQITTNSYDIRLDDTLIRYTSDVIDPKIQPEYEEIKIPETGLILEPQSFHLGASFEKLAAIFMFLFYTLNQERQGKDFLFMLLQI